jgi:uncharacterized protein (DUF433 family)
MTLTKPPKSHPVSVRLSDEAYAEAREWSRRTSRPLGAVVGELVQEAVRMRRFPGIVFAGPPGERRARVGGGPDVWEIVALWRSVGEDVERTLASIEHLSARQLEAALRYYRAHPEEIDRLIEENERAKEDWERLYPHLLPPAS